MAVSVVAVGNAAGQTAGTTVSASTVSITPTMPAGVASGDRIFVPVSATNTSGTTPANWTAVYQDTIVGTGAVSAGGGQRYESLYYRDYDGVWTMPAFTLTSATQNTQALGSIALRKAPAESWSTPTFSGDGEYFGTAGTAFSATTPAAFATKVGGLLMAHVADNDVATATAGTITGTNGFVSGAVTERVDGGLATGNDVSIQLYTCLPGTAGSPAGTLTLAQTLNAASQGAVIFVQQTVQAGKLETLTDDYTTQDTAKWVYVAATTIVAGQLNISGGTLASLATTYDLTSSYAVVNSVTSTTAAGSEDNMSIAPTAGGSIQFGKYVGSPSLFYVAALGSPPLNSSVAFNAVNHRWWRIRESGGTIYFDTSPDGITWSNIVSTGIGTYDLTSVRVTLFSTPAVAGPAIYDSFNILPSAPARALIVTSQLSIPVYRAGFY